MDLFNFVMGFTRIKAGYSRNLTIRSWQLWMVVLITLRLIAAPSIFSTQLRARPSQRLINATVSMGRRNTVNHPKRMRNPDCLFFQAASCGIVLLRLLLL